MIAIPSAFAGGMENWGLVTFGYSRNFITSFFTVIQIETLPID